MSLLPRQSSDELRKVQEKQLEPRRPEYIACATSCRIKREGFIRSSRIKHKHKAIKSMNILMSFQWKTIAGSTLDPFLTCQQPVDLLLGRIATTGEVAEVSSGKESFGWVKPIRSKVRSRLQPRREDRLTHIECSEGPFLANQSTTYRTILVLDC